MRFFFICDNTDRLSTIENFNSLAPNIKFSKKIFLRLLESPVLEVGFQTFIEVKIKIFVEFSNRLLEVNIRSTIQNYTKFHMPFGHCFFGNIRNF